MSFDYLISALVSRWLRRRRRRRSGSDPMVVFCPDTIGDAILIHGTYEHRELNALSAWLSEQHPECLKLTALDVGANIGNHTLYFSKRFHRVVAFEPNPEVFRVLQINVENRTNVEAVNIGLSDRAGVAKLSVPALNRGAGQLSDAGNVAIQLSTLDQLEQTDARIGLLKIDVEGHENNVLLGGESTIRQQKPIVVFESLGRSGENSGGDPVATLKRFGYREFYYVGAPAWFRSSRFLAWLTVFTAFRVRPFKRLRRLNYPVVVAVP